MIAVPAFLATYPVARGAASAAPAVGLADSSRTDRAALVVVVPTTAAVPSVLRAVRTVRGHALPYVYASDDAGALALGVDFASAVAPDSGGSVASHAGVVRPFRNGATDSAYAVRLLGLARLNATGGVAVIVATPDLRDPIYRAAASASDITVGSTWGAGGRPDGVLVLGVEPHAERLVRERF